MAGTLDGVKKLHERETERERAERIRAEERKRHAKTTTEILKRRYGIIEED
jgi:hypothetical protein